MGKFKKKRSKKTTIPGSIEFTGHRKVEDVLIHHIEFNAGSATENVYSSGYVDNQLANNTDLIHWIDVRGIHDIQILQQIGKSFSIHPLVLEDIADVNQRPKFVEYEKGLSFLIHAMYWDQETQKIVTENVSIYMGDGFVISFQEDAFDQFEDVRSRILNGLGRIRKRKSDYLAYALIDCLIDRYFEVLESFGESIQDIESQIIKDSENNIRSRIMHLKRELITMRKSVLPLREAINAFARSDHQLIQGLTVPFIKDAFDHTIHVMDMLDTNRDMLYSLEDLHLSEISFRMNKVMQVLAIVTTLFVPLSFLAGIYGMNFDNIPELHAHYGYYYLLGLMICIIVGLLYFFRKQKWI